MSKLIHLLQIEPPEIGNHEVHEAHGFTCNECNGEGSRMDYDHKDQETGKIEDRIVPCIKCEGTGKLSVCIGVGWTPFYE